jgi:hypothetical protein
MARFARDCRNDMNRLGARSYAGTRHERPPVALWSSVDQSQQVYLGPEVAFSTLETLQRHAWKVTVSANRIQVSQTTADLLIAAGKSIG